MAKILVADDNSNVQKTVALALADLGVDVVSVNNGEAAVRKLSDFSPDLVLADIFMPVRNGYEVCEYIKKDSRFARVPVVLLVGAFDPLDEREAQRVGADGILKKPFIPPDPLITMVKTLLDHTMSDRLVAVSASKPRATADARSGGAVVEVQAPESEASEESDGQEFPPPAGRVAFGEGERPVAFGTLLETPAQDLAAPSTGVIEPVDDEQILTSPRDATLGEPIFWSNDSPEPEPEPEPPGEIPPSIETPAWKQEENDLPPHDEPMALQAIEPLELVRDEQEEASPSIVDSVPILLDAAAQATLTVESGKAEDLAANPIEWMATAPPEESSETACKTHEESPRWDDAIPETTKASDKAEFSDRPQFLTQVWTPVVVEQSLQPDASVADKTVASAIPAPLFSAPPKPQFTESTEDTVRAIPKQSWEDLTASLQSKATELVTQQVKSAPTPAEQISTVASENSQPEPVHPAPESTADAALVEAVVQRVLDKMRPQVVDIITKEFLRPIVQALVHREIEKH